MAFSRSISILTLLTVFISCTTIQDNLTEETKIVPSLFERHIEGASSGNPADQIAVGMAYEKGDGVPVNYTEAMNWYKKAAAKGEADAYFHIGSLFERGAGVTVDPDNAIEWYYSAAANENLPAIRRIIDLLENKSDDQLQWIKKGIELNDPYSFYRNGLILEKTDRESAYEYFRRGADTEDPAGKALIAILSLNGKLDKYNRRDSIQYIKEAAALQNPRALVFYGWLYEFGDSLNKDLERAYELYEEASRQYSQLAIYNLSRFQGEGLLGNADPAMANQFFNQLDQNEYTPSYYDLLEYAGANRKEDQLRVLYRFKASQGDLDAQYQLGLLADPDDSSRWFWMAASEGHVLSMVELARLLTDPIEAAAWMLTAENSGYDDDSFTSADILSQMTEDQKLEVSRRFTEIFYSEEKQNQSDFLP